MKVLVTGGCGFIGSTLVDKLIEYSYDVIVIDNLSAENHEQFYFNDKAEYYHYDICDYRQTRPLYTDVDFVFHLAAESRIQPAINNPIQAVKTNALGTETVLQCSRESGVKKVIYSSTSSSYGLKNPCPLSEDMPNDCLNPYSVSKVAGEELCKMYNRLFGLKTIILRYFNVYGPREAGKGQYAPIVALFLRQLSEGNPLTIVGDGHQRRDFTYIDDVVNANLMAMKVEHDHYGEVFNIGSGVNYSVLELASMISTNQTFIPARIGEGRETLANTTKAQTVLGWKPTVNIKDYIKEQLAK
jgi:nucleoside-diphosphate-sugar epimerase